MTEHNLALEVSLPAGQIRLDRPCPVTVTLINRAESAPLVNPRLAVGYRDHLAREVFAELRDADTGAPVPVHEVDYNRDFLPQEAYQTLAPGESLESTFDLLEWYRPVRPGRFEITFHYQADEALADPPADVFKGLVSSAPAFIHFAPHSPEANQPGKEPTE